MSFLKNLKKRIGFEYYRFSEKNYEKFLRKRGIKLGKNIFWGDVRTINIDTTRPSLVEIGNNVRIDTGMTILTHDYPTWVFRYVYNDFINSSGKVIIGNNVYFGQYCSVLKGVSVGDNCIIGMGSIITKDIPQNSVAVGRPARVICSLEDYYKKRKEKCIEEAFEYARSIQDRFKRRPRIEDFWEEFPLFLNGNEISADLPIKKQLGSAYEYYEKNHKRIFNGFEDFLIHAGIK
jgi:acetyltransferase-like isoleucine patch superfamily enzyme